MEKIKKYVVVESGEDTNGDYFSNVMGVFDTEEEANTEATSLIEDMIETMDLETNEDFNSAKDWELYADGWSYRVDIQIV